MRTVLARVAAAVLAALLLCSSFPCGAAATTLAPTVELRQVGELMIPFQAGLAIPTYEPQTRPRADLTDGWHMLRMNFSTDLSLAARTPETIAALVKEGKGAHQPEFDDRMWLTALVPSVTNAGTRPGASGVWYRRKLSLPPMWEGKRILFHCLAANYVADLWVNGRYVGYHEGGFTPFTFDITGLLRTDAPNVLSLRVDNPPWRAGGSQALLPPGPGDWWNATGLVRDVYLEAVPAISILRADVRTEPRPEGVTLRTAVVLRNASNAPFAGRLELRIYPTRIGEANLATPRADAIMDTGRPVEVTEGNTNSDVTIAGNTTVAWGQAFTTENLSEWSPDRPHVYVLEANLLTEEGELADRVTTQFGVRTLTVDKGRPRLLLNGQPIRLAGLNRVEDDPRFGRAVSYRDGLRILLDLRSAKDLGANFLRLGHGVAHPLTTLLADRMGLVCWEEIPAAWLSAEAMQLQWEQRRIARQTFLEMLYQDYNRPSVGFWGAGHELAGGAIHRDFVRDLCDMARFLDGTRLTGESASLDDRSPTQSEGDVIGYAVKPAVGANQDALAEALETLDRRQRTQPGKPVIITEFGALAGSDSSAWDRQVVAAEDVMRVFTARPYVVGAAWWTLADFQTPAGIRQAGVLSRDRRVTRTVGQALPDLFDAFTGRRPK